MRRRLSEKTKEKRGMGKGEGADYKPYIMVQEFNSTGTTAIVPDWKTGRGVHCLSQGEMLWYYILRWEDENVDVREQFKLDRETTRKIAKGAALKHPGDELHCMTTDFLVTKADGTYFAYAVKPNSQLDESTREKLVLERMYWEYNNVPFKILYTDNVNRTKAHNIRLVVAFYDKTAVFDKYSMLKHMIATKQLKVDMESRILTCDTLDKYAYLLEGGETWQTNLLPSQSVTS